MTDILTIQVTTIAATTAVLVASLFVLSRYLQGRQRQMPPARDPELLARLERIEQVVESTAVEVERISEANRFMAKLLSERAAVPLPGAPAERTTTPH